MFAVIQNGGKQYKVKNGSKLCLEKIDLEVGKELEIKDVLLLNDGSKVLCGSPFVDNASVVVSVLEHRREGKVLIFKKRRRKNSRRKTGHRQRVTLVEVKSINH